MVRNFMMGLLAFLLFAVIATYLLRTQIARNQNAAIKIDPNASLFEKEDEIYRQTGMPDVETPDPATIPDQ